MRSVHWAFKEINELKLGRDVSIRMKDSSIQPKIEAGSDVVFTPIYNFDSLQKGDIVLLAFGDNIYLASVGSVDKTRIQVINNNGRKGGFVMKSDVYGRAVSISNTNV